MVDQQEWERMTVPDALTTRAGQLKERLDWARTRLERAASLVALATEPRRPDGQMDFAVRRAEALSMVEALCESIGNGLNEDPEPTPGITFLVDRAFDANMDATTREDVDRWAPEKLEHMTVGELAQVFKVEDAATAPSDAMTLVDQLRQVLKDEEIMGIRTPSGPLDVMTLVDQLRQVLKAEEAATA